MRIEDTDQTRYVPGAEDYIKESLDWLSMIPAESPWKGGDYGPYRQSERKQLYHEYANQLIESGHAYYAFDSPDELEAMRDRLTKAKVPSPQYNASVRMTMKNSLTLSSDEVRTRLDSGEPYTIRLKVPRNEEVRFNDMIRGWVQVNTNAMDDKVLFKSDGMPTYHLANIVDDHLMKITHVIRGEEWLPSAPTHILLYQYLEWEESCPQFAHLPLILRPDGNGKLSKRDGDRLGFPVFPLEWKDPKTGEISSGYLEKGYFPEAFINTLAFLGWNPGTDKELYTVRELIEDFSIERVGKSGSKFDVDKTKWYNQQYLRYKTTEQIGPALLEALTQEGLSIEHEKLPAYIDLMKERATFVEDMVEGRYLLEAPESYDQKTINKKWKADSEGIVLSLIDLFETTDFEAESLNAAFMNHLEKNEIGMGAAMPILRVLITGQGFGPNMFEIMEFLGKKNSINRLRKGIERLKND